MGRNCKRCGLILACNDCSRKYDEMDILLDNLKYGED